MRTLGDLCWINSYIGLPYEVGGRTRSGLDCYGLCKLVYQEQYGLELPDWSTDSMDLRTRHRPFEEALTSGNFIRKDAPDEGDFVVCYRTRAAHHMDLYFAGGVLNCIKGVGVVCPPLPQFARDYYTVIFGEWKPCL